MAHSAATPQFAVAARAAWSKTEGQSLLARASKLLILAEAGGRPGGRPHQWKLQLQEQLADPLGLDVSVGPYPTGASKWNPIEHRLLGPISINWAGTPLGTFETVLACLRGSATETGWPVKAFWVEPVYKMGWKVSKKVMQTLNIRPHERCPRWNYTIKPRLLPI